ncbi:MAG: nuclear transport factor 2 family protein, partial [Halioglobus sp.]|nr:nuclear transport factor 2 family protein [Halioglobus sp.]
MTTLSDEQLRSAANKLIAAHGEASRSNDWTFFVDEIYARDCVYTCEYAGVMEVTAHGIDDI